MLGCRKTSNLFIYLYIYIYIYAVVLKNIFAYLHNIVLAFYYYIPIVITNLYVNFF